MNNHKSTSEVAAAILSMRGTSKSITEVKSSDARRAIEAINDAKLAESGKLIGRGIFMHETAVKPQTNFAKGARVASALAGVW